MREEDADVPLGGVLACVHADSVGFRRAFTPTRRGSGVRSRRLGYMRSKPRRSSQSVTAAPNALSSTSAMFA